MTKRVKEATREEMLGTLPKITASDLPNEKQVRDELTRTLKAAKWRVEERSPKRRIDPGEMIAVRNDMGRERRYLIDIVAEINPPKIRNHYEKYRHLRSRKEPYSEFDEYWLVGPYYIGEPMRKNPGNDRHFRTLNLVELRALFAQPKSKRGKARTKIGKAIEANEKEVVLAVEALKLQIEDKLARLQDERPNDPESINKVQASISEYEAMSAELERIKLAVQQFKKNEVKEKEVVQTVTTFKESLGKWWHKSHDTILSSASNSALLIGAAGLLHTIGADSGPALAIVGSLIGGETVVKALKALPRSLFKHQG
jgi:hypothetical protein